MLIYPGALREAGSFPSGVEKKVAEKQKKVLDIRYAVCYYVIVAAVEGNR